MDEDLVGCVRLEPAERFDKALVGKVEVKGEMVLVYDYYEIVNAVAADYEGSEEENWYDAMEWVDYNTIRGIEYMGDRRPLILYPDINLEEEE